MSAHYPAGTTAEHIEQHYAPGPSAEQLEMAEEEVLCDASLVSEWVAEQFGGAECERVAALLRVLTTVDCRHETLRKAAGRLRDMYLADMRNAVQRLAERA